MFFFGRANAIAAILDFESRVRLGREESATRWAFNMAATINRDSGARAPPENVCIVG